MERKAEQAAGHSGVRTFLHDHLVEPVVVEPKAAELLRRGHRQHVLVARLAEDLPWHDSVFLPLFEVGGDLLGDEPLDGLAEVFVFGFEYLSFHGKSIVKEQPA